jgi:hypothetical protein
MIAKGVPHAHGARLARYLITGKDGERAQLFELRGFAAAGIVNAFRSVHVVANGSKCSFPFFHVSVRNPDGETLDASQWTYTADAIEQSLGLNNQPRAIAFHICEETGESHMHVAWSRMDDDSLTAKPLPFFKERLKCVSRALERHFGLTEVPITRKGPITYAPTRREEEKSRRLGVDLRGHRGTIRDCFERSDCGRSFQKALAANEIILARGDRRDFLAIDRAGGMHSLGKRILGLPAAEIRARLGDLSKEILPTVEEARQSIFTTRASLANCMFTAVDLPHRAEPPASEPQTLRTREDQGRSEDEVHANTAIQKTEGQSRAIEELLAGPAAPEPTTDIPPQSELPHLASVASKEARSSAGVLRVQFRAVAKGILKRLPSPEPQVRRRRKGDTEGRFLTAARAILGPNVRPVFDVLPFGHPLDAMPLPWLHLWEWNEIPDHDSFGGTPGAEDNHHSPHP